MNRVVWLVISLLFYNFAIYAQDSYQKEEVLQAREHKKRAARLGLSPLEGSRYPTHLMDWGKGFSNGLAKVTINGKAGFIDTKGQIIIKPNLKDAGQFSENLAPFENNHRKSLIR